MTHDTPRLIEHAFPLEQASLNSVHEKNVRHGHISTLHIWPARRPLAACRAALLATLLPDPGDEEKRRELCEKIGGRVVNIRKRVKKPGGSIEERVARETRGGVLHWHGQPKTPEDWNAIQRQKADLEWFRKEIQRIYGRAPKVLDPFAGGGAIPLEAMRLGCEATAVDINPVAWFILKCTLEYPQKLAGERKRLPDFVLRDRDFMTAYFKALPGSEGRPKYRTKKQLEDRVRQHFGETVAKRGKAREEQALFNDDHPDWSAEGHGHSAELEADLAWHVRAWGHWVLAEARKELAPFYPTYADWEPLKPGHKAYEKQPMRLVPLKNDGTLDMDALNGDLGEDYLDDETNPRWVAKPTVAYLWARTVQCKDCGATVPLLKTRWLCKKDNKRVMLTMESLGRGKGVRFGIQENVPAKSGSAARKREHDKKIGAGTMSKSGATCPCCGTIITMGEIRLQGKDDRLGKMITSVIFEGSKSREYRIPSDFEVHQYDIASKRVEKVFETIPGGQISEPLRPASTRSISCDLYGIDNFKKVFIERQQLALGVLIRSTHELRAHLEETGYPWSDEIFRLLALNIDRVADRSSSFCRPDPSPTQSGVINTFSKFALPMTWDFIEGVPINDSSGGYIHSLSWIFHVIQHLCTMTSSRGSKANVLNRSASEEGSIGVSDIIMTDPPYYEAISYADLSDFFYIWLKRLNNDTKEFHLSLTPKNEEIVQHVRSDKVRETERERYELGMAASFRQAYLNLEQNGRLVVVFAHKQPDAWEKLVSAMISAGFVVTASWPIQTEMTNRGRALSSAALASSVWLVCKKRAATARPGWDTTVLAAMRENITEKLRNFWDAGIRGPDFVWAATGPALEAYSKHPVVKKADEPGKLMSVSEFLVHARRMVVDFVVGQVLSGEDSATSDLSAADRLDEQTAYYLLHRHDFGMAEAPTGPVILYAVSCGMSDGELVDTWDLLARVGKKSAATEEEDEDPDSEADADDDSGSKVKLKTWQQRKGKSLGLVAPKGRQVPLIDRIHRLMHLWRGGDLTKVDEYIDENGLRRSELFKRVAQSLIELSEGGSSERSILESISNHLGAKGAIAQERLDYK